MRQKWFAAVDALMPSLRNASSAVCESGNHNACREVGNAPTSNEAISDTEAVLTNASFVAIDKIDSYAWTQTGFHAKCFTMR